MRRNTMRPVWEVPLEKPARIEESDLGAIEVEVEMGCCGYTDRIDIEKLPDTVENKTDVGWVPEPLDFYRKVNETPVAPISDEVEVISGGAITIGGDKIGCGVLTDPFGWGTTVNVPKPEYLYEVTVTVYGTDAADALSKSGLADRNDVRVKISGTELGE
jgi:hypothetical protein